MTKKNNETVMQYKYKNTENYCILIHYCNDERYLQVKIYIIVIIIFIEWVKGVCT